MSTLHIFSKPLSYYNLHCLKNVISPKDTILLVGDGCYATAHFRQLTNTLNIIEIDAKARAINTTHNENLINYDEFVALTLSSTQSITW